MDESTNCITLLTGWHDFCDKQRILHDLSRGYFRTLNMSLSIPSIMLSTIGGAANIGFASSNNAWSSIFFGSMSLLAAGLITVHRNLSIAELQQQHDFYSDEFAKLANEIKMHLYIENTDSKTYKNIVEFCKDCKHHLDVLIDKAPPVPFAIRRRADAQKHPDKNTLFAGLPTKAQEV